MPARFAAVLAVAALALGACGGDEPDGDDGSGTAATTQTTAEARRDAPIADAATLKLSDLPAGWTAKDEREKSSEARCQAIIDAKRTVTARNSSPTFEKGNSDQVEDVVYVFEDEATAERSFSEITSAETRTCIREHFADSLKDDSDGAEIGAIESGELNVERVGDDTAASRFTIPVSKSGIDIDVTVDLVVVRANRAVSFLVLISTLTSFDDDLRATLTARAARRIQDALAA